MPQCFDLAVRSDVLLALGTLLVNKPELISRKPEDMLPSGSAASSCSRIPRVYLEAGSVVQRAAQAGAPAALGG